MSRWLTESEQATPVDSIKDVVRSSMKVAEFDKHLKKVGGHIDRNVVEITIKMKTIVRKHNDKNHQASSQKFRQLHVFIKFNLHKNIIMVLLLLIMMHCIFLISKI